MARNLYQQCFDYLDSHLAVKIFLDRYSAKDVRFSKESVPCPGTVVLFRPNEHVKEVGIVLESGELSKVKSLGDDAQEYFIPSSNLDIPLETPDDMWKRVAKAVASVEETADGRSFWEHTFYELLKDWKFLPGGRILAGAGIEGVTLANCFVIESPEDSREGIMKALNNMTELMARGGGVGINVSTLRPRYSYVAGVNGRSSGAVSWAALYSFVTGLVEQGGSRRGALLMSIEDWHPDIIEFIQAKKEAGKITNANISVDLSDEFMQAVKNDLDWDLYFPDTSHPEYKTYKGDIRDWKSKGLPVVIHKTVKAQYIWNLITESAWASAEPGVLFRGNINNDSNSTYYEGGRLITTNPCYAAGSLVMVPGGYKKVEEVKVGDLISTTVGPRPVKEIESHRNLPCVKVSMTDGSEHIVTPAHQFYAKRKGSVTKEYTPICVKDLKEGDLVRVLPVDVEFLALESNISPAAAKTRILEGFLTGLFLGNGSYTEGVKSYGNVSLSVNASEEDWINQLVSKFTKDYDTDFTTENSNGCFKFKFKLSSSVGEFISKLPPAKSPDKSIEFDMLNSGYFFHVGLLDGLISTDGNVNLKSNHPQLRIDSSSKELLQGVRRILLLYGIHSVITSTDRNPNHKIQDREINSKTRKHTLNVSGESLRTFIQRFKLSHPEKSSKLKEAVNRFSLSGNRWSTAVKSVECAGNHDVYDLYEESTDTWSVDGVLSRGCGEQNLPAWGVCNLGHINLAKFDRNGKSACGFDLKDSVTHAVRFLDNVVSLSKYYLPQIEEQQKLERRVGLGTLGLAEHLINAKIRYGSSESIGYISGLYKNIAEVAYTTSWVLGLSKGSYGGFDLAKSGLNKKSFFSRMQETLHSQNEGSISHFRNVCLLTQAPTGTVGTMVNTSTGIEPYFSYEWKRKGRLGEHIEYARVFKKWKDENPNSEVPDYFVTAMELSPEDHVKVQAAIQEWTDSSISKTCNIPENWTIDQVSEVYMKMYDSGCKGGTIYRDNSRSEQVLENIKKENPEPQPVIESSDTVEDLQEQTPKKVVVVSNGNKRKVSVRHGSTVSLETNLGTVHVTMNSHTNPFEVFVTIGKAGSDVQSMAEGLGRLISLCLQNGVSHEEIANQLDGIGGSGSVGFGKYRVSSLPDAVAKALLTVWGTSEDHMEGADEDNMRGVMGGNMRGKSLDLCPECGDSTLVRQSGCKYCSSCGYSAC